MIAVNLKKIKLLTRSIKKFNLKLIIGDILEKIL